MRWSIKSLMLYTLVFALCLAICNIEYTTTALILCVIIALLGFVLPGKQWRYFTWGIVGGIIMAFFAASIYVRMRTGTGVPRTYALNALTSSYYDPLKRYLFPVGAFVGGSLGLLLYKNATPHKE
jgi:hypothetical protein